MKLKIKKYLFLINDLSNLLLNKERAGERAENKRLKLILSIVSACLVLSIILNFYLYIRK